MLRNRFGIVGNHRELTEKVLSNIERYLETSEMSGLYRKRSGKIIMPRY
jgi:hypothetical protein